MQIAARPQPVVVVLLPKRAQLETAWRQINLRPFVTLLGAVWPLAGRRLCGRLAKSRPLPARGLNSIALRARARLVAGQRRASAKSYPITRAAAKWANRPAQQLLGRPVTRRVWRFNRLRGPPDLRLATRDSQLATRNSRLATCARPAQIRPSSLTARASLVSRFSSAIVGAHPPADRPPARPPGCPVSLASNGRSAGRESN